MALTHNQKRFIKKNIKSLKLEEIASRLSIKQEIILEYIKDHWREEKYNDFVKNARKDDSQNIELKSFELQQFIKSNWMIFILFVIIVLITYFNAFNNAFVSDDIAAIRDNPTIGTFKDLKLIPIFFLRIFFYVIAYKVGGLDPALYRGLNIFFHIGNVMLIYLLLNRISKRSIALIVALIFAAHPILIESVGWISGGIYAQYSFFTLLGFFFYLLSKTRGIKYSVYAFICFIFAFSSSEKSIIFPFILLLYEFTTKGLKKNWKRFIPYFSLFALGMIYLIPKVAQRWFALENEHYSKISIGNPFVQVPVAISSYLELIFWPDKLSLYHSELVMSPLVFAIRTLVIIVLFGLIIFCYKKQKMIFFWLSFFVITLLPTLTPLKVSWVYAERYVYLGSIGIFFTAAWLLDKLISNKKYALVGYIICYVMIIGLMVRSIYRNFDWKNEDTMWIATGKTAPSDPKTHNNLGDYYYRHQDYPNAIKEFKRGIELNSGYADAYHNLGNVYFQMRDYNTAIANYQKALSINPRIWQSHQSIAVIYFENKQLEKSLESIKKALAVSPTNPILYGNLSTIYSHINDKPKAKEALKKAMELDPNNEQYKQAYKSL